MKYNPDIHHRRSTRLRGFNYSRSGAYFVTICAKNRQCLLGSVVDGEIRLNDAGNMVQTIWEGLPNRFPFIELGQFAVMPNHVHGIIMLMDSIHRRGESRIRPNPHIGPNQGDHKDRPYGTLTGTIGRIIQTFKSATTHEYIIGVRQYGWLPFFNKFWQRNYYERVIRNEVELNQVRQYIQDNRFNWETDEENPQKDNKDGKGWLKMKITLAILADYANITREGKLNILGIFDVIHAQDFPVVHPQMQLVMRFEADISEAGKTKKVEIQLMDEDGKRLFVLDGQFTLGQGRPGEVMGSNQILTFNMLKFENAGHYEFKILINDELKAEVPLKVVKFVPSS